LNAATDGLLPDGREAALVLFGQEAVYMPMIAGIYKKVRNSGEISTLSSHVVYENDDFSYWIDEGGPHLRHAPLLADDRGKTTSVYAVCKLKDGSVEIETMTVAQVEKVRAVSRSKGGPWKDWWDEMARKTVVRRLSKRLPMSSDQERVMQRDDSMYDLEQKPAVDAPLRPQRVEYQPEAPAHGENLDEQYRQTMADDETESGGGETLQQQTEEVARKAEEEATAALQGRAGSVGVSTPAPAETPDRPFLAEDGRAILYDGKGKELSCYERAGNFFKAVMEQIAKEDDPTAFLKINERAANHFVKQADGNMDVWVKCWDAANSAEAARDAME
jgi:recombination protein RecT